MRLSPAGNFTEFVIPTPNSHPLNVALGPDGNVWFTEVTGNKIGRITAGGIVSEFPIPTPDSHLFGIAAGPDGNSLRTCRRETVSRRRLLRWLKPAQVTCRTWINSSCQGNSKNLLSGQEAEYLKQIGADEDAHVQALTQTITKLGGKPVAKPSVDFADSFASRNSYLKTSHTFENLGVSAYLGAAGSIKSKEILQAAAGIFGVEARHAAVVGNLLGLEPEGGVYMGATETPKTKSEVLSAADPFITS